MKSGQVILGPMEPFPEANFSCKFLRTQMDVEPTTRGKTTQEWMVYFMDNPKTPMNKWMIWGVKTRYFWFNTQIGAFEIDGPRK